MNKQTPLQKPGKSAVSSDILMLVLLVVALFQITLCFSTGSGLVDPARQFYFGAQGTTMETNAPLARSMAPADKSPGMESATNRG